MSTLTIRRDSLGVVSANPTTFEAEWANMLQRSHGGELTYSHRSTTSSRRPGAAITGTVHVRKRQLVACEKCHRLRIDLGGAHGPLVHPDGSVTDCTGDVVTAAWRIAQHTEASP